jgi:F-type H+-transporting ATPase subunit b
LFGQTSFVRAGFEWGLNRMGGPEANTSGAKSPWSDHSLRNIRNRSRTHSPFVVATGAVIASLLLAAGPALAAGSLVLVPDWLGVLPFMLVGFVLLIFPLNALLFQPIFRALDERAERIAGARERSDQLQRDADEVLDRYQGAIREARAEAESARQAQLEGAREEQVELTSAARETAERELEGARGEMNQSIEAARASLRASAEGLAQAAAEQVLGRTIS